LSSAAREGFGNAPAPAGLRLLRARVQLGDVDGPVVLLGELLEALLDGPLGDPDARKPPLEPPHLAPSVRLLSCGLELVPQPRETSLKVAGLPELRPRDRRNPALKHVADEGPQVIRIHPPGAREDEDFFTRTTREAVAGVALG
jgi:hypothetical protein